MDLLSKQSERTPKSMPNSMERKLDLHSSDFKLSIRSVSNVKMLPSLVCNQSKTNISIERSAKQSVVEKIESMRGHELISFLDANPVDISSNGLALSRAQALGLVRDKVMSAKSMINLAALRQGNREFDSDASLSDFAKASSYLQFEDKETMTDNENMVPELRLLKSTYAELHDVLCD